MIGAWYRRYEDAVAADSGVVAFFKWLLLGLLLQAGLFLLSFPLLFLAFLAPRAWRGEAGGWIIVLSFLATRVLTCVVPAARVSERKGRAPGWLWGVGALCFGQVVLAAAAAVPPADATK